MLPTYPEPLVFLNLLSKEERTHIMTEAKSKLRASTVAKKREVDESVRKSETAYLSPQEDPVVRSVIERCVSRTDRPIDNCENLQVVRYQPGGFFKPHQDAFMEDENKRLYTFVIALNDDYEGGETIFPNLHQKVKLTAGDALFFHTLDNYEQETPKALHGGEPVKSGEKWICNVWIHKNVFHLDW